MNEAIIGCTIECIENECEDQLCDNMTQTNQSELIGWNGQTLIRGTMTSY